MADLQVTCINKPDRDDRNEAITHLGGYGWHWPRQWVIDAINDKSNTYFTLVNGSRAYVAVVDGPNGQYLRTHANGAWNDNLLALNECVR